MAFTRRAALPAYVSQLMVAHSQPPRVVSIFGALLAGVVVTKAEMTSVRSMVAEGFVVVYTQLSLSEWI